MAKGKTRVSNTINLNYYIKNADNINAVLQSAHDSIKKTIKARKSGENIKHLESILTKLFYPTSNSFKNRRQQIFNLVKDYLNSEANGAYEILDISDLQNITLKKVEPPTNWQNAIQEKMSKYVKNNTVKIQGLKNYLQKAREYVDKLSSTQDLGNISATIESLNNALETSLSKAQDNEFLVSSLTNINDGKIDKDDILEKYHRIRSFIEVSESVLGIPNTKILGDVFEYSLALFKYKAINGTQEVALEQLKKYLKNTVRGGDFVDRGGFGLGFARKVEYNIDDIDTDTKNESIPLSDQLRIEYSNISSNDKKQGKLDVLMSFAQSTENADIRASAKNWGSNRFMNIGGTNILAALDRTLNDSSDLLSSYAIYSLQNQGYRTDTFSKQGIDLMHLACVADILTGYSQQNNYANTLIINSAKDQHIYVKDMESLLQDTSSYVLEKFNESEILGQASQYRNEEKINHINGHFFTNMSNFLLKTSVELHLNSLG